VSDDAEIGIIGGSGLYRLLPEARSISVPTPYGDPSGPLTLAEWHGRRVAFLPRHGPEHQFAPHAINYRANVSALASLGVRRILAPCAVGSLRADRKPGEIVVCDQFLDHTGGQRMDTLFHTGGVAHVSAAQPYCSELRPLAVAASATAGLRAHDGGTIVVVRGPRFSTTAESRWYASMGGHVIGMTQYPEVILARELGVCYTGIALITDYDCGLEDDPAIAPVTQEQVFQVFAERIDQLRAALGELVERIPSERGCACEAGRARLLGH
jgi:5'-methylthioadenosine phosphorylase